MKRLLKYKEKDAFWEQTTEQVNSLNVEKTAAEVEAIFPPHPAQTAL